MKKRFSKLLAGFLSAIMSLVILCSAIPVSAAASDEAIMSIIRNGLLNGQTVIDLSSCDMVIQNLSDVNDPTIQRINRLVGDARITENCNNIEIADAVSISPVYNANKQIIIGRIGITYKNTKSDWTAKNNAENNAAKAVWNSIATTNMSDLEKAIAINKWLVTNVKYVSDAPNARCAIGALVDKKCVCEGFGRAFDKICNYAGLECELVVNSVHMWVKVKIDGEWYNCDPTWDGTDYNTYGTAGNYFIQFLKSDSKYKTGATTHDTWRLLSAKNIQATSTIYDNSTRWNFGLKKGDYNCNGVVDITDLSELAAALVDKRVPASRAKICDMDNNGVCDASDLAALRQKVTYSN